MPPLDRLAVERRISVGEHQRNRLALAPHDDIQATGAVKAHLAGVLLRRVAAQLMEARP